MSTLTNKKKRTQRVRFKLKKKENLRLSIFRSNKFLYAQLIDDSVGKTLFSSSSIQKEFKEIKGSPKEIAFKIGESIGDKILENKIIKKICFDRGGYLFHGRVKEFAMGVRSKGIKF
jgi:large subunit ribosomal protein L18